MDWMYKEDKPEQEEYLLGRKVDKYIENTTGRNDDLGGAHERLTFSGINRRSFVWFGDVT